MSAPGSVVPVGGKAGGASYLLTLESCPGAVGIFTVRPCDRIRHSRYFAAIVRPDSRDHLQCRCCAAAAAGSNGNDVCVCGGVVVVVVTVVVVASSVDGASVGSVLHRTG